MAGLKIVCKHDEMVDAYVNINIDRSTWGLEVV